MILTRDGQNSDESDEHDEADERCQVEHDRDEANQTVVTVGTLRALAAMAAVVVQPQIPVEKEHDEQESDAKRDLKVGQLFVGVAFCFESKASGNLKHGNSKAEQQRNIDYYFYIIHKSSI